MKKSDKKLIRIWLSVQDAIQPNNFQPNQFMPQNLVKSSRKNSILPKTNFLQNMQTPVSPFQFSPYTKPRFQLGSLSLAACDDTTEIELCQGNKVCEIGQFGLFHDQYLNKYYMLLRGQPNTYIFEIEPHSLMPNDSQRSMDMF